MASVLDRLESARNNYAAELVRLEKKVRPEVVCRCSFMASSERIEGQNASHCPLRQLLTAVTLLADRRNGEHLSEQREQRQRDGVQGAFWTPFRLELQSRSPTYWLLLHPIVTLCNCAAICRGTRATSLPRTRGVTGSRGAQPSWRSISSACRLQHPTWCAPCIPTSSDALLATTSQCVLIAQPIMDYSLSKSECS